MNERFVTNVGGKTCDECSFNVRGSGVCPLFNAGMSRESCLDKTQVVQCELSPATAPTREELIKTLRLAWVHTPDREKIDELLARCDGATKGEASHD